MPTIRVFISHSNQDKPLADALQTLLLGVFGNAIVIYYSSDDAPDGGIRAGGTWLEWIMTTVHHTDVCIAILTEDSASAPWVLWETGAVTGVATRSEAPSDRSVPAIRVVPLTFGIHVDRVPAPLKHHQAVRGDHEIGVSKLLFMLGQCLGGPAAPAIKISDERVSKFVESVQKFMDRRAREHPVRLLVSDLSAVHLVNCKLGLTLEPRDGEIANGIRLQCGRFTGDAHQRWLLHSVGPGTYRITTADGTKCLSIQGDSEESGAAILLWDYEEHPSQHWQVTSSAGAAAVLSTVSLTNKFSKCLLSSDVTGNDIVQARRANVTNEDWWILLAGRI